MLNRTASSFVRNASPLSPALLKLEPEQRMRLMKSSQKVGKVLGITPVIDVVSPSVRMFTPPTTPGSTLAVPGPMRSFVAQHSPVAFLQSVTSKASSHNEALRSPVMQFKVHVTEKVCSPSERPPDAGRRACNRLRRKHVPAALTLAQAQRTEALPLSPFRYGILRVAQTPALSPLSPVSPVSPITEAKVEESKLEKLDKLEKLAQCANLGIPQELIYPSFGQVEEIAEQITSFLDLYLMRAQRDGGLPKVKSALRDEDARPAGLMDPDSTRRMSRRSSRGPVGKRRSRSAGDFCSFSDALELESPCFSRVLHSPSLLAPPPTVMSASFHPYSLRSSSIYSQFSAEHAFQVPVTEAEFEAEAETSPGLQRRKSISRARQTILGADARLMADFRIGFGTHPLDFPLEPFPAPTGALPSPPVSPRLAQIKSPRVPYWVKSSFRPRDPAQALQYVSCDQPALLPTGPKRYSSDAREVTPRTLRFERRMGWSGQWNQGSLAGAIDSLKQL